MEHQGGGQAGLQRAAEGEGESQPLLSLRAPHPGVSGVCRPCGAIVGLFGSLPRLSPRPFYSAAIDSELAAAQSGFARLEHKIVLVSTGPGRVSVETVPFPSPLGADIDPVSAALMRPTRVRPAVAC